MSNPAGYDYLAFRAAVALAWNGDCWGCRLRPWEKPRCVRDSPDIDAHHLLPKQAIKRQFPWGAWKAADGTLQPIPRHDASDELRPADVALSALLMDVRNGVLMRRWHHDGLENRAWVAALDDLPADAIAFAHELGLLYRLGRTYNA